MYVAVAALFIAKNQTIYMNLDAFFNPKSVAVIGASKERGKVGFSILEALKDGYKGEIYPVNPHEQEIMFLKAYKSVLEIKEAVDLAVVAVPKEAVAKVLKECVKKKIPAIVVVTSGYSEAGDKKSEEELLKTVKGSKTRILGPNCLGIFNAQSQVDTLFLPKTKLRRPKEGWISFLSQSGAFGSTLLDMIADQGIGIAKFVSYGNQAGVKDVEFLEYLGEDEKTKVIVMYMEGVSDGRKFMDIARKISAKKPLIIFKAGKTEKGSSAATSHTGALAGSYDIYRAAFRQAGIIEAESIEDIFDFAKALEKQATAKGKRIAVVTNGGGFGVITSDSVIESGLELAEFSPEAIGLLKGVLPSYGAVHNPLDLVGDADQERYRGALEILVKDKNVDGIIVISLFQTVSLQPSVIDVISEIKNKTQKPIVVCATGGEFTKRCLADLEKRGIPTYITPERAVKGIAALVRYGEILRANKK